MGMRGVGTTEGRLGRVYGGEREDTARKSLVENDGVLRHAANALAVLLEEERDGNENDCETAEQARCANDAELGVHLCSKEGEAVKDRDGQRGRRAKQAKSYAPSSEGRTGDRVDGKS